MLGARRGTSDWMRFWQGVAERNARDGQEGAFWGEPPPGKWLEHPLDFTVDMEAELQRLWTASGRPETPASY